MGNKPHRLKKRMIKAIRQSSQDELLKKQKNSLNTPEIKVPNIKPVNSTTAKEMLKYYKNNIEHLHLKIKPHHRKRTTPGSLDEEAPYTMKNYHQSEKRENMAQKINIQKSADISRKYLGNNYKKAA